jgi:amidase
MTTLADGTDSGGSIRAPASACGLFGYLPPHGRNPSDRSFAYEGLLRYGPMARSVADAALMQNVTAGWHPEDPATLREQIRLPPAFGPLRGMRIALSLDLGYYEIDHEVAAAVRCAAAVFAGLGCTVTEIALPWTTAVADAMNIYVEYLVHAGYGSLLPSNGAEMSAHVSHLISRGATLRGADVAFFFATRRTMYEQIRPILEEFDLLLCPTLATPGVVAEHNSMDPAFTINGKPVGAYLEWGLTYPFNMLCYLPVASVPCGFARNNLPIGMQLVGRTFDDLSVFHAAAAFEAAQPWRDRRPTLPSLTKS